MTRAALGAIVAALVATASTGCGSHPAAARHRAGSAPATSPANGTARPRAAIGVDLHVVRSRSLPAPVQLPGLARAGTSVLAVGGLDAADSSVADVVRVAPGSPRRVGTLPAAVHDVGATTLGSSLYVFGGGSASGPTAAITQVAPGGRTRPAGRLPVAMSDTTAVTIGATAYIVGGYTTTTPLRSVLAYRPGQAPREVGALPHPLRYAAVAAVGGRLLIAGGTDGTSARDEILSVDPARHRTRVIGHLPARLAHAAGAALGGLFYVLGGRGDGAASQRRAIWAIDPATGRVRPAGRLPTGLSDLAATAAGNRLLVAGGRDAHAGVHRELLELAQLRPARRGGNGVCRDRRRLRGDPRGAPGAAGPRRSRARVRAELEVRHGGRHRSAHGEGRRPLRGRRTAPAREPVLGPADAVGHQRHREQPHPDRPAHRPPRPPGPRPRSLQPVLHRGWAARHRRRGGASCAGLPRAAHDAARQSLRMPTCAGVDHMDFTADGRLALVSCEFAGRMVVVDLRRERVVKGIDLRGGRDAPGRQALARRAHVLCRGHGLQRCVADRRAHGCEGSASSPRAAAPTASTPAATRKLLYVSNRGAGTITLISFRTRRPVRTWRIPGGGSPDMGGVSADGRVLWLVGPLQQRGVRDLHQHRPPPAPHSRRAGPARPVRLAPARALLDRAHRHPALAVPLIWRSVCQGPSTSSPRVAGSNCRLRGRRVRRVRDARSG